MEYAWFALACYVAYLLKSAIEHTSKIAVEYLRRVK